jgi:hypothetical protein
MARLNGIRLADNGSMILLCRHCDELITGSAYRVISEEDGVILLDMIVCETCASEAKCLQLHTEEITLEHSEAPELCARVRA